MTETSKQQTIMDEVLRSNLKLLTGLLPYMTGATRKATEDRLTEIREALKVGKKPGKKAS